MIILITTQKRITTQVPEAWFKERDPLASASHGEGGSSSSSSEEACCTATGFIAAGYAANLEMAAHKRVNAENKGGVTTGDNVDKVGVNGAAQPLAVTPAVEKAMVAIFLEQLDEVFAKLEPRHMAAAVEKDWNLPVSAASTETVADLPKPSDVFVAGMVHRWAPDTFPFIRGGYSSTKAGAYNTKLGSEPPIVAQGKHGVYVLYLFCGSMVLPPFSCLW
jgi:hypothetical protein